MTITLDISPEAERELQERADIEGIDLSKLAADILEGVVRARNIETSTVAYKSAQKIPPKTLAERIAALDALIAQGVKAPSISDEALSSEGLYD